MSEAKEEFYKIIEEIENLGIDDIKNKINSPVMNYIKELEEQNRWISVKDKLPPSLKCVWCYYRDEEDFYQTEGFYEHKYKRWSNVDASTIYTTHWRPLPELPEDK